MRITPREIGYHYPSPKALSRLPEHFGVLCWNLNKEEDPHAIERTLKPWWEPWRLRLLCFQEARFDTLRETLGADCEIHAAANLQLSGRLYGVATASPVRARESRSGHSRGRELLLGPKKPYLFTYYAMPDGSRLLNLNIHAINFRESRRYHLELEAFKRVLAQHRGPMIVAGDFNQWNPRRHQRLDEFRKALGMEVLTFENEKVKRFLGYPLDLIFYRGLKLRDQAVVETKLSDHNPILASFALSED